MGEPAVIEVVVAGPQGPVGPVGPENTKATEEVHAEKTRAETAEGLKASKTELASAESQAAVEVGSEKSTREAAVTAEKTRAEIAEAKAQSEAEAKAHISAVNEVAVERTRAEGAEAKAQSEAEAKAHTSAANEVAAEKTRAEGVESGKLVKAKNLEDITSAAAARSNLGLGSAAVEPASAFDAKGMAASAQSAAEAASAQGTIPTTVKTSAYTAAPGQEVRVDISGGSVPVQLPTKPADRTRIGLKIVKISGTVGSTSATLTAGGTDVFNVAGGSTTLTLVALFQGVIAQYVASDGTWVVQSTDTPLGSALGAAKLGTDGTIGGPGGSSLNNAVVTSGVQETGEIEGEYTPNVEGHRTGALVVTAKGNLTIVKPTGWAAGESELTCVVTRGTHTLKLSGIEYGEEGEPVWPNTSIFTLWTPNGGATVYLFVGPRGNPGATGATGARGEVGPSSIEAMTRTFYPFFTGSPRVLAEFTAVQWKMYFFLGIVPVKCKKLNPYPTCGSVVKGHLRAMIFDCGTAKANKYTCLAAGSLYEPKATDISERVASLEKKVGEWEAGEPLMIGIGADNAEIKLGASTNDLNSGVNKLPGGVVHGTSGLTTVLGFGEHLFTEATFTETEPKEIAEANITPTITKIAMLVGCE